MGLLLAGSLVGWMLWRRRREAQIIRRWAAAQRYSQVRIERPFVPFDSPFGLFTTGRGQSIVRVSLIDNTGTRSTGYARLGSYWWGLWSDRVETVWDRQATQVPGPPPVADSSAR